MFWALKIHKGILPVTIAALIAVLAASATLAGRRPEIVLRSREVLPMGPITFETTRELAEVRVAIVPPAPLTHHVDGRRITLRPLDPLRPGGTYEVTIEAVDTAGARLVRAFSLHVAPLREAFWVYVKLDAPHHRVDVYQGDELVRSMIASGGRPGFETPEGVFRIQNRGYHFFSQKYQEGAYYWVRIFGNYLFHSVPVDVHGNVIEEEARKLGCPASHGCVRLSFPDAKWFYDHVPDGALVVIDRS